MENNNHYEVEKTCEVCGKTFMAKKINARFCSQRCQKRAFYKKRQEEECQRDDYYDDYEENSRREMDRSFYGVLGGLFGVGNHGCEQEQMLTSLLAVQKDKMESSQSISLMKYQLENLTKQYEEIKAELSEVKSHAKELQSENDKLTKENEKLSAENEELSQSAEANSNKVNQIGSIAGVALTQALMGLLPNTKLGQLMGFGGMGEPDNEDIPPTDVSVRPSISTVPNENGVEVEEMSPHVVKQAV